ncbi:hypothetical protein HPT27_11900 [Permianibacter sp. IMCC34836]|uniref:C2 family cysteine protease n=1 Tax=Permianibacter fluminis TaxID=2738515 RepID=UPI00155434D1|nr:C2 family cysteine protease [Permianibacter fluminis]NQD37730.1 hypothetical protein [Permianibacter fluminis]
MDVTKIQSQANAAQKNGVINPYALAETIAGRRIAWSEVDAPRMLETLLATPYEELFDPKYDSPLYLGLKLNKNKTLEPFHSPLFDVTVKLGTSDLETPVEELMTNVKVLGDLARRFEVTDVAKLAIHNIRLCNPFQIELTLKLPSKDRLQQLAQILPKSLLQTVAFDPELKGNSNQDWTPPNANWTDKGTFFNETAEFFDPVQGAVANCYYIAALAAIAWASPYRIAHLTRAIGQNQQSFTNLVKFFKPDSGGQIDKEIEVTDVVPVSNATGNFIYCRSSEAGETWPAIMEKAFAKFVTGTTTDHPDILATGWGDCVLATAQLTGGQRHYYGNSSMTGDDIWNLVRSNSLSRRTFNPMTCWTYGTAPDGLSYADANIVGSHCYTVLGWDYHCGKKYLVLRNPWGQTEGTASALNATVWMYDISWWRPIELANPDGTFAIEAGAFQQYFAGIGVVK